MSTEPARKKPKYSFSPTLGPNGMFVGKTCETETKIYRAEFVWVIHNYSDYKAELPIGAKLESPHFYPDNRKECRWRLRLMPNGVSGSTTRNGALFLNFQSYGDYNYAFADYKLSILDENQKEVKVSSSKRIFERLLNNAWGDKNFIKNDDVVASSDKLTIYCEVTFSVAEHATNDLDDRNLTKLDLNVSEPRLAIDFGQLFNDEETSDVVISVNRKNFKAHKLILSTRSPVFAAMFKHSDMKESQESKVVITDFDEKIVEEMLKFIYTGKSANMYKLADKLLVIAEKYEIRGLKDMSERVLVETLSVKNAVDTLVFADFHGAHKLKSEIIKFIGKQATRVMKTTAWKNIVVSHPQLVIEVGEGCPSVR